MRFREAIAADGDLTSACLVKNLSGVGLQEMLYLEALLLEYQVQWISKIMP